MENEILATITVNGKEEEITKERLQEIADANINLQVENSKLSREIFKLKSTINAIANMVNVAVGEN